MRRQPLWRKFEAAFVAVLMALEVGEGICSSSSRLPDLCCGRSWPDRQKGSSCPVDKILNQCHPE